MILRFIDFRSCILKTRASAIDFRICYLCWRTMWHLKATRRHPESVKINCLSPGLRVWLMILWFSNVRPKHWNELYSWGSPLHLGHPLSVIKELKICWTMVSWHAMVNFFSGNCSFLRFLLQNNLVMKLFKNIEWFLI